MLDVRRKVFPTMKTVLFVDQFGKNTGNDTLALAETINKLKEIKVDVYVSDNIELARSNYISEIYYGFHNVYSGNVIKKAFKYLKSLRELKRHIISKQYDVVHLQWFSLPFFDKIFIKKIQKKSKVVITVHDVIPFDKKPGIMKALKKIYKISDVVLLHTKKAESDFKEIYKLSVPTQVITQGFCDKNDYHLLPKKEARKHLNVPDDRIVFLFYGSIRESKGLDLLIEAIDKATRVNKNIFLLCAGAFQKVEGDYYVELSKKITNKNAGIFNFGFVPREEEQYYFSAADVLCLPYKEVTQSGVAQLGLMYNLPMIATNVGAMDEVVRHNQNGFLINCNDCDSLADAIIKICNKETLCAFSKESEKIGINDFSISKKASLVSGAYKMVTK